MTEQLSLAAISRRVPQVGAIVGDAKSTARWRPPGFLLTAFMDSCRKRLEALPLLADEIDEVLSNILAVFRTGPALTRWDKSGC